jgi:hypothetical protein
MAFCTSCGTQVQAGGKFCVNCGAPIASLASGLAPFEKPLASTTRSLPSAVVSAKRRSLKPDVRVALASTIFVVPQHWLVSFQNLMVSVSATPLDVVAGSAEEIQQWVSLSVRKHIRDVKYVCLIGLWSDVPPYRLPNPTFQLGGRDPDSHCLSDAPYGCFQSVSLARDAIPDVPVGRIPSLEVEVVATALFDSPEWQDARSSFFLGVTAQCWTDATHEIVKRFMGSSSVHVMASPDERFVNSGILTSPHWSLDELEEQFINTHVPKGSVILFNVHGGADDPGWVGEDHDRNYVPIFEPGTIQNFNDSIFVTEACYGGAMGYDTESVVEHFFSNGGKAFVGCSVVAYGSASSDIGCADILATSFLQSIGEGRTLGEALTVAKCEVLISDPISQKINDKTVLSFNLFGAPWHCLKQAAPASAASRLPVRTSSGSALDRIRNRMNNLEEDHSSSLSDIRLRYLKKLPTPQKQFLLNQQEARSQLSRFSQSAQIHATLNQWHVDIENLEMEFFSFEDFEGFLLSGHSHTAGAPRVIAMTLDATGKIIKTLTSKG